MSKDRFRKVTGELLAIANAPPSSDIYNNVTLTIDGIAFSLMHSGVEADETMTMFCDFGAPDDTVKPAVVKALLAANAAILGRAGRESFCMNPVSGHILASSILPMPEASARLLFEVLGNYAQQAKKWQQTYALRTDTGMACTAA